MSRNSLDLKNPSEHASWYDFCLATERDPNSERRCTLAAPPTVGNIQRNLIVAPCIFVESLQFINQRMHI